MLIVISPAKTLDFTTPAQTGRSTQPELLDDSQILIDRARQLSALDIADLMKVSMKIADLNFERFESWQTPFTPDNAKQALLAFKGDVYTGLGAEDFSRTDLDFAQKHLRILSGLYGLLRPLDLMQPYRLEMGRALSNPRGKNLYQFWGEKITQTINRQLNKESEPALINLASNEYFKSVKPELVAGRLITPNFKELKNGGYKVIGVHAKKARGMMSRFIIKNRLTDVEDLKSFTDMDYHFNPELSNDSDWIFTR
ncbi:MAG: peroxide stress protein YaaA [Gammaproteobacteria bacterium]|nr:peroxide stress protein YaaA [Gammaproteobacteria bacterium]